ncbi:DNA-directed RNA polymerase subunit omega, partial [Dialister invisus]
MMCYPAIDALVKKVDTKYTLVTLAALRARELTDGAPALLDDKGKKTVTVALEEIY